MHGKSKSKTGSSGQEEKEIRYSKDSMYLTKRAWTSKPFLFEDPTARQRIGFE